MFKKVAFTMYPVSDVPRARKFYEETLGLTAGLSGGREGKYWIEYDLPGGGCLAITNTTGESVIKDTGGAVVPSMLFLKGVVGVEVVGRVDPSTGQQTVGISTSQEVPGAFPVDVVNKFQGLGNRISWKLLGGQ